VVPSSFAKGGDDSRGQVQGRKSATDPQCQQFPPFVKECLASRFLRGSLISWDLSQLELRIAGLLSGEPSLVNEYLKPKPDLHSARAIFVFGPDIIHDPHWKDGGWLDPRQWCKTFNFEDLYLAGALKMQAKLFEDTGVIKPLAFFQQVVRDREILRPVLCDWQRRLIRDAERDGYLILPFTGHSRTFFGGDHKPNEIVNFPVQCTGAITMTCIENEILRRSVNRPWRLSMDIHDALVADVPFGAIEEYTQVVASSVEEVHRRGYWARLCDLHKRYVPLTYEIKTLNLAA
jgi:hypothetical protein